MRVIHSEFTPLASGASLFGFDEGRRGLSADGGMFARFGPVMFSGLTLAMKTIRTISDSMRVATDAKILIAFILLFLISGCDTSDDHNSSSLIVFDDGIMSISLTAVPTPSHHYLGSPPHNPKFLFAGERFTVTVRWRADDLERTKEFFGNTRSLPVVHAVDNDVLVSLVVQSSEDLDVWRVFWVSTAMLRTDPLAWREEKYLSTEIGSLGLSVTGFGKGLLLISLDLDDQNRMLIDGVPFMP